MIIYNETLPQASTRGVEERNRGTFRDVMAASNDVEDTELANIFGQVSYAFFCTFPRHPHPSFKKGCQDESVSSSILLYHRLLSLLKMEIKWRMEIRLREAKSEETNSST